MSADAPMTAEEMRAHIAWLGTWCERCLVLAAKYDGRDAATAATLRATAETHARSAQTWAEALSLEVA